MAEPTQPREGVEFSGFGIGAKLFGANALFFFLLIMLALNLAATLWQNSLRNAEHDQIMCSTKLAIFIYTSPRNEKGALEVNFERLPVDMYGCLPKFLFDRKAQ